MKKNLFTALTASLIIAFSSVNVIALAEQFPLTITAASSTTSATAEIRISGIIHQWQNSSAQFKQEIDALIAKGITDVSLYINTPGGSVFEANEIANEIRRFKGTITGYGGALVASAGGYLALICDTFEMPENGQFMYHKPMGMIQGNEDKVASDLKLLQNFTKDYRKAYADKTGMTEDEIEANWVKGDVWLTAQEAKDAGFITAVSPKKEKITEGIKALFIACGIPNVPTVNTNEPDMKNRNAILSALGLAADATDEQIEQAVKDAKAKADLSDNSEQATKDAAKIKAEAVVTAAHTANKIDASQIPQWNALATTNYEGTKAILESMPAIKKVSEQLTVEANAEKSGREKWTLDDYLANDPQALTELEKKDPDKFVALNEAYYGITLK